MLNFDDIGATLSRIPNPLALLESLFALAPVGFQIFEAGGRSILVNQTFRDLFGSEPPPGYNILHDEIIERSGMLGRVRQAFAGETVTLPTTWYDPRDLRQVHVEEGNRVAVAATVFPIFDRTGKVSHVGIAFRDVTAETHAREALEHERELLSTIVEQSADGIVVCDENGIVRIVNEAARRLGLQQSALPLHEWVATFSPQRADGSPVTVQEMPLFRALQGSPTTGTAYVATPAGRLAITSSAVPLRYPDGRIRGAVTILRDETERLRREEETRRAAHFRERFIGILGHDLRSPLTAITANAGLVLRHDNLPPAVSSAAARTASTAMRMGRMISDLLDFTQARLGGGLAISRKPCDLRDVAQAAIDEACAAHPSRTALFECQGVTQGPYDPDRVSQLLSNLLHNAFSYSPADSAVLVTLHGDDQGASISVANRGQRIPADELARLFDPFRRGSAASNARDPRGGLGLGLYIVQQIVHAHGGDVAVTSDDEKNVFRVRLQR